MRESGWRVVTIPRRTAPAETGTPRAAAEAAVAICRSGDWGRGLTILADLVKDRGLSEHIPGVAYSFLGYGIARYQKQVKEGLRLCQHAVKAQFYHPECHLYLARVQSWPRTARGPSTRSPRDSPSIRAMRPCARCTSEIGVRKRPVIGFLSRNNPVNRTLGKLRRQMKTNE